MSEAKTAPYEMSNEYLQHLNRLLTGHGFGPQDQGVTIDWDGLDSALKAHYRTQLISERDSEVAGLKETAGTRKRHKRKDDQETNGGDESAPDGSAETQ